jgi:general secretion pathway protein D
LYKHLILYTLTFTALIKSDHFLLTTNPINTKLLIKLIEHITKDNIIIETKSAITTRMQLSGKDSKDIISQICENSTPKVQISEIYNNNKSHKKNSNEEQKLKSNKKNLYILDTIEINYAAINKDLEKTINNFWSSLTNKKKDKKNRIITLHHKQRVIIARGTESEIKNLKNFIANIDRPKTRVRLDIVFVSVERKFDISTGINWSGIYNRLNTIKESGKKFDFVGMGGTLTDIPEPTTPVFDYTGNLFVNPENFSINTFSPPISDEFAQVQGDFFEEAIQVLRLPIIFGGPNLNLRRLNLLLNASEIDKSINIMSKPSIITNDEQVAKLLTGNSLPFYSNLNQSVPTESQANANFATMFYREIGIAFQVKPKIHIDKKHISIDFYLEFSEITSGTIDTSFLNLGQLLDPPTLALVKIKNNIILEDGQTILIGGISQLARKEITQDAPFLTKIPIIGRLFSSTGIEKEQNDKLIFITPTIIE